MKTRLITAGVASAIVITLLVFRFTIALPIGLAIIGGIGVFEIIRAAKVQYNIPLFIISEIFALLVPFINAAYLDIPFEPVLYTFFALFAGSVLIKFDTNRLPRCFVAFLMIFSLVFGLSCAHNIFYWNHGMFYFLLAAFCAFITDSGAYFVGSSVGKTHFAPTVSPNKTLEGSIGGLASSLIVNIVFAFVYSYIFADGAKINFGVLIITVILASLAGMIGDLFASAVKRTYNIKDYGKIMPGHGGIVDRCDSIIFSLSVVMMINQYFFVF